MMKNTLPLLTPPADSTYAALPPHALNQHGVCIFCEESPYQNWTTYEEYEAWWYANEYEGEPGHYLTTTKENWNYLAVSCLAGD